MLTPLQKLPENVGDLALKSCQSPINRPIWSHCMEAIWNFAWHEWSHKSCIVNKTRSRHHIPTLKYDSKVLVWKFYVLEEVDLLSRRILLNDFATVQSCVFILNSNHHYLCLKVKAETCSWCYKTLKKSCQ